MWERNLQRDLQRRDVLVLAERDQLTVIAAVWCFRLCSSSCSLESSAVVKLRLSLFPPRGSSFMSCVSFRIKIEEEYAKNLSKLSLSPLAAQEEG